MFRHKISPALVFLTAVFFCFAFSAPSQAKTFTNKFIEFQLPDKWECALDGSEWVCQSTDEQKKRDAVIILVAKVRKEGMDELATYKSRLAEKQGYEAPSGQQVESEPRYVKEITINNRTWVDALHLQGELPDFYTRYLATVEADLGILATFSVRKDKFSEYSQEIENMVKSLRAFRTPGPLVDLPATGESGGGLDVTNPTASSGGCAVGEVREAATGTCVPAPKPSDALPGWLLSYALFGAIALFVIFLINRFMKRSRQQ